MLDSLPPSLIRHSSSAGGHGGYAFRKGVLNFLSVTGLTPSGSAPACSYLQMLSHNALLAKWS